jgi:hypothetical protein
MRDLVRYSVRIPGIGTPETVYAETHTAAAADVAEQLGLPSIPPGTTAIDPSGTEFPCSFAI